MKTDTVYKRAYNDALDVLSRIGRGGSLPSETELSQQLGASRTTVRKIISTLAERGIVRGESRARKVVSAGKHIKRFPKSQTVSVADRVERRFMEWMLRDNMRPGTLINELEMARRFGVATTVIREFLNRFKHFGLIEKRPNAGWLFKGFTAEFALQLFEIREMFEHRSARAFAELPKTSPLWQHLQNMRQEHVNLLADIDDRYQDFSGLDSRFHQLINSAGPNRFIDSFYDLITLVFHYHYQWNKKFERQRNEVAIGEHLVYIDALFGDDFAATTKAIAAHLASAKLTLMQSTTD